MRKATKMKQDNNGNSNSTKIDLKRLECANTQLKIAVLRTSISGFQETLRRANLEMNTVPGKIDELKKQIEELQQQFEPQLKELRELMDIPESANINLDTGEVFS